MTRSLMTLILGLAAALALPAAGAAALREVRGADYFRVIDQQRRMLVPRIRNHDWQGLFAPAGAAGTAKAASPAA